MENASQLVDDFDKKNPMQADELKLKKSTNAPTPETLEGRDTPSAQENLDWKIVDSPPWRRRRSTRWSLFRRWSDTPGVTLLISLLIIT